MENIFKSFPILETERLVLRQLSDDDRHEIFKLRSDELIHKYLARPLAETIMDAQTFIKRVNDGFADKNIFYWGISLKGDKKIIGTICLWKISKELSQAEAGYELLHEHQGHGYINEAFSRVIKFAFEELGLCIIEAEVAPGNQRSVKVLKKFNFIHARTVNESDGNNPETSITHVYKLFNASKTSSWLNK